MRGLTLLFLFSLFLSSYTVIDKTEEAKKKKEEKSLFKNGKVVLKPIKKKIIKPIKMQILKPTRKKIIQPLPKKIIYPIGQKPKDINSSKKEKKSVFTPIEELNKRGKRVDNKSSIKPVSLEE